MRVVDQLGRTITLHSPVRRIISMVPSQTELLVDLGLEDSLVGITKFCVHPPGLIRRKVVVGGTKSVRLDKVETLSPDFILCNKEENTPETVQQLERIAPVYISDIVSIDDTLKLIQDLGLILEVEAVADVVIKNIQTARDAFLKKIQNREALRVVYLIWRDPYMAAGQNTFINHMLELNGYINHIEESRYPEVSIDQLRGSDLILLSTEPFPFKQEHADFLNSKTEIPCRLVDGEYFSWFGSRIRDAFDYFLRLEI